MKTLKFDKRFYDKVLSGEKDLTTRKDGRYSFEIGERVVADFGDKQLKLKIVKTAQTGIDFKREVTVVDESFYDAFFKREGFNNDDEFFAFLSKFSYKSGVFTTYQFELIKEDL